MPDPLARALAALQALHAPRTDPVSVAFWEEVRDAILEAQRERAAFVAVVRTGRGLIDALDRFEAVTDEDDTAQLDELAAGAEAAEDAFVEALNRVPADLGAGPEGQPWGEEAFLVALDHLSETDEDDPEEAGKPRH